MNTTIESDNNSLDAPYKSHCYNCEKETNQDLLFKNHELGPREIVWRNEMGDESQSMWEVVANIWILSKCRGCEKINFNHIVRCSPTGKQTWLFIFRESLLDKLRNG